MDNQYSDIKKAVDALLKINSTVKRKKKAYLDKQKDLFIGIIITLQASQTREFLTQTELKLDFSSYDEMFLQIIDSLLSNSNNIAVFLLVSIASLMPATVSL